MNLLNDIITYIRRIIKSPSDTVISDALIIDYINRFWIIDVDARIQLFDLKTKYQFQTSPGVDRYNMPLYSIQTEPGPQSISFYPVYQGFTGPALINGIQVPFYTDRTQFTNLWSGYQQTLIQSGTGDGSAGPYTLNLPFLPNSPQTINFPVSSGIIRGHVDITGIIATGVNPVQDPPIVSSAGNFISTIPTTSVYSSVYFTSTDVSGANTIVCDSGEFLSGSVNYGLLMQPGGYPNGNLPLTNGPLPNYSTTQNTINYNTGIATNVYFPTAIPVGMPINGQCVYYQQGIPRSVLFFNNIIELKAPPNTQYLVELEAYLSPAAFFSSSQSVPFAYMSEYIARGAARKILSDTGDVEQFMFYEPLFKEQETLVWKRSQRQFTSTRTQTIYSMGINQGPTGSGIGQGLQ
jgi:hypothetical protein